MGEVRSAGVFSVGDVTISVEVGGGDVSEGAGKGEGAGGGWVGGGNVVATGAQEVKINIKAMKAKRLFVIVHIEGRYGRLRRGSR